MAKDNKINMPSSGGGLTSFYDESESKVQVSAKLVIVVTIAIAIIIVVMNNTI